MKITTNPQRILCTLVERSKEEDNSFADEAQFFEYFCSKCIMKNEELSDEDIENGMIGKSLDGGCDSIYILYNGINISEDSLEDFRAFKDSKIELIIIQSKRESSFGETPIMKLKEVSKNLLDLDAQNERFSSRYNQDVLDKFILFRNLFIKNIGRSPNIIISYYYATFADSNEIHPNVLAQAESLKEEIHKLFPGKRTAVNMFFWGANELIDAAQSHAEPDLRLPLIEQPINPEANQDYIALVNIAKYYNFICDENKKLRRYIFEFNVRDYQGHNAVNKEIENTLRDADSGDFWWLNNGITLLADEVNLATSKELILKNPAIVNGLQTSTEIYNYFDANPEKLNDEKRNVLVRIIVPKGEEYRDRIILATNNQTSIPKSQLRVNDPIHWQIELILKSHNLFYDRRKNYYKNQGKKSHEIISVSFLAQCMISLLMKKPNYARARPSTILSQADDYEKIYNQEQNLDVFCNVALLGKKLDIYLKKMSQYTQPERHDIIFYALYYAVAKKINKEDITPCDIKKINIEEFDDKYFDQIIKEVYDIYVGFGGNGTVAKSNKILSVLFERIREISSASA